MNPVPPKSAIKANRSIKECLVVSAKLYLDMAEEAIKVGALEEAERMLGWARGAHEQAKLQG
jgi:hypothetical protein